MRVCTWCGQWWIPDDRELCSEACLKALNDTMTKQSGKLFVDYGKETVSYDRKQNQKININNVNSKRLASLKVVGSLPIRPSGHSGNEKGEDNLDRTENQGGENC